MLFTNTANIDANQRAEMLKNLRVIDIMSKEVVTVDTDDLIGKATRLMIENRSHSLLVMKLGKPTYVISSYDLLKVSYEDTFSESHLDMLRTKVEELVKGQNLISVTPETNLLEALKILVDYNIHSMPVIDEDGNVAGMLTLMDLTRWYKKSHGY